MHKLFFGRYSADMFGGDRRVCWKYMEVKHRPRYIISERVGEFDGGNEGIKDAGRRAFPGEKESME